MNNINKKAYPQSGTEIFIEKPHDLSIWIKAMRYIYAYINKGMDENSAFDLITAKWDTLDKLDFKNWMKYYQTGGAEAYKKAALEKTAQYFPAFLDVDDLKSALPGNQMNFPEENEFERPVINKQTEKQKADEQAKLEKEQAAQLIKALLGRLNSAERIAVSEGIAKILGANYENWLRALHELKKEIQVAPFRMAKSALITDLIIRKGNQLYAAGDQKSAKVMYKLAQVAPPPLEPSPEDDKASEPTATEMPAEPSLTDIPTPNLSAEPNISPEGNKDDAWVEEFLNGLEGLVDDKNDIMDVSASEDLYVSENDLKVFAQEVPQAPVPNEKPDLDVVQNIPAPEGNKLEQALAGTTVDDVIAKLEAVSNVFKNREVPRQLAMVDIMMDQLGLASYFTELGESISKALEANQYCATRIEDVLGRLKGSVSVPVEHELDLAGEKPGSAEGNAIGLKNKLEQEKQKEDVRKKNREEASNAQEDAIAANKPSQVNTDALNQPSQIQTPQNNGVRV